MILMLVGQLLIRKHQRLNREKAVWQRLRHKNVLPLLAYTLGATPALISQYCSNGNLPIYTKKQPLRFIHKLKLVGIEPENRVPSLP